MNSGELRAMKTAGLPIGRAAAALVRGGVAKPALVSAGIGAAAGAASAEEGERVQGAFRGGIAGGAVGASAGGIARAAHDHRLLNPYASTTDTAIGVARRVLQAPANFAKRQVHGVTGAFADRPGDIGLRSSATAAKKVDMLERRHRALGGDPVEFAKARDAILEEGRRGDAALKAGVTSLPGIAKGLAKAPKETLKAMWAETTGGSPTGSAIALGLPLALAAPDLARGDESARGGKSIHQKVVGLGTNLAGGIATAGLPVVPQILGGIAVDAAGQKLVGTRAARNEVV